MPVKNNFNVTIYWNAPGANPQEIPIDGKLFTDRFQAQNLIDHLEESGCTRIWATSLYFKPNGTKNVKIFERNALGWGVDEFLQKKFNPIAQNDVVARYQKD